MTIGVRNLNHPRVGAIGECISSNWDWVAPQSHVAVCGVDFKPMIGRAGWRDVMNGSIHTYEKIPPESDQSIGHAHSMSNKSPVK